MDNKLSRVVEGEWGGSRKMVGVLEKAESGLLKRKVVKK